MRLRSWFNSLFAHFRPVLAAYRPNPRAVAFGASCWLVYSGVSAWSVPAARLSLGAILLLVLLITEPRAEKPVQR